MKKQDFFKKINFNKSWTEADWELFFQAQEAYRLSKRNKEIRKTPMSRIKFEGPDDVEAFDPVLREYGMETTPDVIYQIRTRPFDGDEDPDSEYTPTTQEDSHFWGEGAPLASLPIYRDCCRFAITTSKELDKYLKKRGTAYRRKHKAEFENLRFHANWVAINVAQGHHIGYARERIRGNIARCLRSVKHADQCISLINRVSLRTQSYRLREELFSFAAQLRNEIYMWIDELRSRYN